MIDWIKTIQGIAAIVAVIFPTIVARWNLGLPRLVFSPELAPGHAGGIVDPFNGNTDGFRIAQVQRSTAGSRPRGIT